MAIFPRTDINLPAESGLERVGRRKNRAVYGSVPSLTGFGSVAPEIGLTVREEQTTSTPTRTHELVARLEQALVEHRFNG